MIPKFIYILWLKQPCFYKYSRSKPPYLIRQAVISLQGQVHCHGTIVTFSILVLMGVIKIYCTDFQWNWHFVHESFHVHVCVCNWLCFSCRHISFYFCWLTALSQIWTERGTPLSTPPVCLCPSSLWGWAVPTSVTWTSWTGMMGSSRELMADQPRGTLCSLCHLGISRR